MLEVAAAGALAGLVSAPHCALMCGPLGVHATRCGSGGLAKYQVARTLSYLGLGVGAGLIGEPLISLLWSTGATLALSLGLALVMLIAAVRVWPREPKRVFNQENVQPQEHQGLVKLRPRKSLFARIIRRLPKSPALIGACSALLPCGALWGGIALAVATGSPTSGAVLMVFFSLTSGIGVWASARLVTRKSGVVSPARARLFSVVLAIGAVVLVWRPLAMQGAFVNIPVGATTDGNQSQLCPLHSGGQK